MTIPKQEYTAEFKELAVKRAKKALKASHNCLGTAIVVCASREMFQAAPGNQPRLSIR